MTTVPSATVICDSVSSRGHRLTTVEATFHRFILAEVNTHRMFSRNSASSRAIPVSKQRARVMSDCAYPVVWPKEQSGMQGGEDLPFHDQVLARREWQEASADALVHAERLSQLGVHKSVTNRLLEPFMWHTAIITSTHWNNFYRQRCSPLAQPEFRQVADAIRLAIEMSTPREVEWDEWHLPYVRDSERQEFNATALRQLSSARCARVSYLTHEGIRDPQADFDLYDRLVTADPAHASPLEHVATPCATEDPHHHLGNFEGWKQYRHLVLGDANRRD